VHCAGGATGSRLPSYTLMLYAPVHEGGARFVGPSYKASGPVQSAGVGATHEEQVGVTKVLVS